MRHSRPEGLAVIRRLSRLGAALGYAVHEEHRVGRSAAVDLAWTAADSNDVPLFVFEVESKASTGLANNALKVYGSPLEELAKPLFFFHIVLSGRADNERIRNAQRQWGQHNYRVYRLAEEGQAKLLAIDVLRQHRRVNRYIDPLAVAGALEVPGWGGHETVNEALTLAESLRFDGPYLQSYARMAMKDFRHLDLLARRARALAELPRAHGEDDGPGHKHLSREGYGGGPGDYVGGLLETALRVYAGDLTDAEGPGAFEGWATSCGYGRRMIEPAFGLDADYDAYVIGTAPVQYALDAALLGNHALSRDWVLRDWAMLLEGERRRGMHAEFRLPAAIWLAHALAATSNSGEGAGPRSELDVDRLYSDLEVHVLDNAGVPEQLLLNPPGPFHPLEELPEWVTDNGVVPLPPRNTLREMSLDMLQALPTRVSFTPLTASLKALVEHDVYFVPGRDLLTLVYSVPPQRSMTDETETAE